MFRKLRNSIWKLVTSNLKEGMILPRWAYCIRVILFPFEYLRKDRFCSFIHLIK